MCEGRANFSHATRPNPTAVQCFEAMQDWEKVILLTQRIDEVIYWERTDEISELQSVEGASAVMSAAFFLGFGFGYKSSYFFIHAIR